MTFPSPAASVPPGGSGPTVLADDRLRGGRRAALAALVLLLAQYVLGMAVNLYVTVPKDTKSIGAAVASGPAVLGAHVVLGLALAVAAIGLLAQSIRARHGAVIAASAVALAAIGAAIGAGSGFLSSGAAGASMAMAVATGVAVLAYAAALYALGWSRPQRRR